MALEALRTGRHATEVALLDRFHFSASESNITDYFGCFSSPTSRFLGTDATENWSALKFYDYAKPYFDDGSAWTYVPRANSRKFEHINNPDGTPLFVTFDELLDVAAFGATARGTGTMIFDQILQCWFIVSYHLSFPTPNSLAHEICQKISVYEKKMQVKDANDKSDAIAAELMAEFESNSIPVKVAVQHKTVKKKGRWC